MLGQPKSFACMLPVVVFSCLATAAASDDLVVDVVRNQAVGDEAEEVLLIVGRLNGGIQLNQDDANERQFEQQIFSNGGSSEKGRKAANDELKTAIHSLHAACRLSQFQRDKLALAGQADQKRFFDRVEAARTSSQSGKNRSGDLMTEMQSLRTKHDAGLLGAESFFAKSVRHTLTADQLADCRQTYLSALVEQTMRFVDRYVMLEPTQRAAIAMILLEGSSSPPVFWRDGRWFKKLEVLQMNHRFSKVAETKIKPLLNDEQWQDVELWLEQFRTTHDAMLLEEGRVVPGQNELVPVALPALPRKNLK